MVPHLVALMLLTSTPSLTGATSYKVVIGYTPQQLLTWITSTPEGFNVEETDVPGQTGQCQCRVKAPVSSSSSSGPFTWPACSSSDPEVVWPEFESSRSLSPCSSSPSSPSSSLPSSSPTTTTVDTTAWTTVNTTLAASSALTTTTTTTTNRQHTNRQHTNTQHANTQHKTRNTKHATQH